MSTWSTKRMRKGGPGTGGGDGGTGTLPGPTEVVGVVTVVSSGLNAGSTTSGFADVDWPGVTEGIDAYRVLRSVSGGAYSLITRKAAPFVGEASRYMDTNVPVNVPVRYIVETELNGKTGSTASSPSDPVTISSGGSTGGPTTGRLSYEDQWHDDSNYFNQPIPGRRGRAGSPTVDPTSAAVMSKVITTVTNTKAAMQDQGEMPPIFHAPPTAGTFDGITWSWYTTVGNDTYTGTTLLGGVRVLMHSGVAFGGGSDNPLTIVMPKHNPPGGPVHGDYTYVRYWQGISIDHSAKTISARSGGVFPYGPNSQATPKAGNGLGWGAGWVGVIRRADVAHGEILHAGRFAASNTNGGAGNFWVPSASGSGSSSQFRFPAIKTDQTGGSGGACVMGMRFQLNPQNWSDAQIRGRYVWTGSGYQSHAQNVLRDRGPGSGHTVAWPAEGGPKVTERELLHMIMVQWRDFGIVAADGGGPGFQVSMEHRLTAKWPSSQGGSMSGEPPNGEFGWGRVLRDHRDPDVPSTATDCGMPWGDVRVLTA